MTLDVSYVQTSIEDSAAFDAAFRWTMVFHNPQCGQADLDALMPSFREWLLEAPQNRTVFREVWGFWDLAPVRGDSEVTQSPVVKRDAASTDIESNIDDTDGEARRWVARLGDPRTSKAQLKALDKWLLDPAHAEAFEPHAEPIRMRVAKFDRDA